MSRRKGFVQILMQAQRDAERKKLAQLKELARRQTQAARAAEQARKDYERAKAANEKERARLYIESRQAQVDLQNEELEQQIYLIEHILIEALSTDTFINLESLKEPLQIAPFNPGHLATPEMPPQWAAFLPPEPHGVQKLLPGSKERYAQEMAKAQQLYQSQVEAHRIREAQRQQELARLKAQYEQYASSERQRLAERNKGIDDFKKALSEGKPEAVVDYFTMVLDSSIYPENFSHKAKVAYIPESKQLVIEYDLPPFEIIPEEGTYKYNKSKDVITATARPLTQRKTLYASLIAQIALRTLYELFTADRQEILETIVYNGYVETISKGTGLPVRACLLTVRTSRNVFMGLNLRQVDPQACLTVLNASVSKNPSELSPVRPVIEFSMVDPRFIEATDILSDLDQRPNLMELTPTEFESLITNLFEKMGLETRQTQASRDGGVDCVAFDNRPIFGGKVIIQAKRYKHTVGVSAVRDLYGTVLNEGASKGILVTTSGYGEASYEFAKNKPLELISGSNLLYLLKEHAGIEAKIEIPEGWKDPQQDS